MRLLIVALFLCGVASASARPTAEPLPSGVVLFDSNRTGTFEIFRMNRDGSKPLRLTRDAGHAKYDSWWPRPSPDRSRILFVRTPAGTHDLDYTKVTTWVMNADGSNVTQILPLGAHGWTVQGHPEWRPDSARVATMGGDAANAQIYTVAPDGSEPVRLTNDGTGGPRPGLNIDPSWRRDGRYLLFVGCPAESCSQWELEVYRIAADGTGTTRLTSNRRPDNDPYYSPSSTIGPAEAGTVAWLQNTGSYRWGIKRMRADGSEKRVVIDDGGINSKPSWSLDSRLIYFHRIPRGAGRPLFNVWSIRPDGTGLQEVIRPRPASYANEFPANSPY